jgi:hypothetical protein
MDLLMEGVSCPCRVSVEIGTLVEICREARVKVIVFSF